MRNVLTLAAALTVVGMPGAALAKDWKGPVTPANQEEHFMQLFTSAGEGCIDSKRLTHEERVPNCEDALAEIADKREAARNPSVAEVANYDFYESFMSIALANAYSNIDKDTSKRTCVYAERSWRLSHGLMGVDKKQVNAEIYALYQKPPAAAERVLGDCRRQFGKPADGAPMPSELQNKR